MSIEDLKISQFPPATTGIKQGFLAKTNPTTGRTEKIGTQEDLGAVKANFAWQSDTIYPIDEYVEYQNGVWQSLQNSNTGNVPTENAFWTNKPISDADGITDTQWAAGMFTYDDSKIVYENVQYYLQIAAPYESTDIVAEIAAGDWVSGKSGAVGISDVNSATYTTLASDEIINVLYTTTGAVTITIQTSMITNGFNKLVIKDAGGNAGTNNITIVGEGGETIDGQSSLIFNGNYSAVNLYANNSSIKIY